ncbi:hypothetical protein [Paenibacillus methanolicus]|uniref:Uncharacterized protein n=1 Tax=Paenibacillus methanolicus TaxID=582686 RepID=A0A5S5C100_9BACL|nr:hypothetical protein [Paenibacillus methanolicus]TYP72010.1 hypothetical protein BCM02_109289 [Paenibacillus methanolicus]
MLVKKTIAFIILALSVCGCTAPDKEPSTNITKVELVKRDSTILYGNKGIENYSALLLAHNGMEKSFDWATMMDEQYPPVLEEADLNHDGTNEVVVILLKAKRPGVMQQELHVLNANDLSEVAVEDHIAYIKNTAKSVLVHGDGMVRITLELGEKKYEKQYNETLLPDWPDAIYFGPMITYAVTDNQLTATALGAVSTTTYAMSVRLDYDESFKIHNATIEEI